MTELVQSGNTYTLTNAKSGTVMDLSGVDNKTIIGFPLKGGNNQKWTLTWESLGWTFKSVSSGLFLGINGSPADGTRLIAVSTPFYWDIWHDDVNPSTYRIFIHNTHFNLDLSNFGDPTPGAPITLWWTWGGIHQTWNFTKV